MFRNASPLLFMLVSLLMAAPAGAQSEFRIAILDGKNVSYEGHQGEPNHSVLKKILPKLRCSSVSILSSTRVRFKNVPRWHLLMKVPHRRKGRAFHL